MIDIPQDLQAYASDLEPKTLHWNDESEQKILDFIDYHPGEIMEDLLRFGVIYPYADAFRYKYKGVLLVGDNFIGKTTIASKFAKDCATKKEGNAKIFSQDNPVLYCPSEASHLPLVYLDEREKDTPFLLPFVHPHSTEECTVDYVFHLQEEEKEKEDSVKKSTLESGLPYFNHAYSRKGQGRSAIRHALRNVQFFDVVKRPDPDGMHIGSVMMQIKEILDAQ